MLNQLCRPSGAANSNFASSAWHSFIPARLGEQVHSLCEPCEGVGRLLCAQFVHSIVEGSCNLVLT